MWKDATPWVEARQSLWYSVSETLRLARKLFTVTARDVSPSTYISTTPYVSMKVSMYVWCILNGILASYCMYVYVYMGLKNNHVSRVWGQIGQDYDAIGRIRSEGKGQGATVRTIDPPSGLPIAFYIFPEWPTTSILHLHNRRLGNIVHYLSHSSQWWVGLEITWYDINIHTHITACWCSNCCAQYKIYICVDLTFMAEGVLALYVSVQYALIAVRLNSGMSGGRTTAAMRWWCFELGFGLGLKLKKGFRLGLHKRASCWNFHAKRRKSAIIWCCIHAGCDISGQIFSNRPTHTHIHTILMCKV